MFSQDWVDHMKQAMSGAKPGDTFDVFRISFIYGDLCHDHGSTYVKTEAGYRSCSYSNRHLVVKAPFTL